MQAQPEYRQPNWLLWLFVAIILAMWMIANFGCTTQRKAVNYMNSHDQQTAEYCAGRFPVKDSVVYHRTTKTDTLTVQGEPAVYRDTIIKEGQTMVREKVIPCPPVKVITQTHFDTLIMYRENTAKVESLAIKTTELSSKLNDASAGRSNWRKWALITWAFIAVGAAGFIMSKLKFI